MFILISPAKDGRSLLLAVISVAYMLLKTKEVTAGSRRETGFQI